MIVNYVIYWKNFTTIHCVYYYAYSFFILVYTKIYGWFFIQMAKFRGSKNKIKTIRVYCFR